MTAATPHTSTRSRRAATKKRANGAAAQSDVRRSPERFINRETSWLEFNRRVLEEAANPRHPLFERLRFLAISGSNMDEFYMVRVAGLREMARRGVVKLSDDGLTPSQQLAAVSALATELIAQQGVLWADLRKQLRAESVFVLEARELTKSDREWLREDFLMRIFPLLTPLAVDSAHPFPFVPNLGFNLALDLSDTQGGSLKALVPIPLGVPRFVTLPCDKKTPQGRAHVRVVALETVVELCLDQLFPGYDVEGAGVFRVIRDTDIDLEEEAEDLVAFFESALKRRRRGDLVRLTVDTNMPESLRDFVTRALDATPQDVILVRGFLGIKDLSEIITADRPDLLFPSFEPRSPERVREYRGDMFAAIRAKDILVHHPYETFDTVVDFIRQAAADPKVLAIKQTLYRTSRDSPIVAALCEASEAGKNVTAIIELKARFDEEANLGFARHLENAGVQVVYGGFVKWKTHAKLSLVVRREGADLRAYTHVGTGNYHPLTAKIYTDLSLFTADPATGRDAGRVFNFVTGYAKPEDLERFAMSPLDMKSRLLELIATEAENARAGKPAAIWAKMNSLVHPGLIDALYEASDAGVEIDLVIRGICCLRPGVPGLSDTIRVKSIVGRFLEHARIWAFANGAKLPSHAASVYLSSADWMPRNLERRVEVMAEITNPTVHRHVLNQIMVGNLRDERQSWLMQGDGGYVRHARYDSEDAFCAHAYFMEHPSLSGRGAARVNGPPPARPGSGRS